MYAVIKEDYFGIYKNIVKKSKDLSYIIDLLNEKPERATDYGVELVKSKYFETIFKNYKDSINDFLINMIRSIDWERFQEILPKIKKYLPGVLKRGPESWHQIFRDNEDKKVLEYFIQYHRKDALKNMNEIIRGLNRNRVIEYRLENSQGENLQEEEE